jgi:hypothetical protein
MSCDFLVHSLCTSLHERTRFYEMDVKHYLERLAQLKQSGFSAATLPMMRLADDERNLRQLADAIKKQRDELIQETRVITSPGEGYIATATEGN